jgi:thioredoxin-like negative regulator of GroEL
MPVAAKKTLRFKRMDPFDRYWWVSYVVVVLSISVPTLMLIKLNQSKIARRFYEWKADPVAQAHRCLESGRATEALAPLQFACANKPDSPELIRALAAVGMEASPAEARRCFHKLEQLGLATPQDRASHATLLAKLHDFAGAKAVLGRVAPDLQKTADVQRAWLAIHRESGDFTAASEALDRDVAQVPDDVDA